MGGRLAILNVHAKNKKVNPEISLSEVAKRVPGFSGADLANLMNEAAILTGRRNKDSITALEIDDSIDRCGRHGGHKADGRKEQDPRGVSRSRARHLRHAPPGP